MPRKKIATEQDEIVKTPLTKYFGLDQSEQPDTPIKEKKTKQAKKKEPKYCKHCNRVLIKVIGNECNGCKELGVMMKVFFKDYNSGKLPAPLQNKINNYLMTKIIRKSGANDQMLFERHDKFNDVYEQIINYICENDE